MDKAQIKSDYDRDGFVQLPKLIPGEDLFRTEEALSHFIEHQLDGIPKEQVFYEDKDDPSTLKQIQLLHEHDPFFNAMMSSGPVREVAECILGCPVVAKNLQYFNKPPGIGQPTPPHQDGYYFMLDPCEAVTLWLALDEVDEENGCVHYVRSSHKGGLLPHNRTNTLGFSQGLVDTTPCHDPALDVACPAHPGDLLAHDARTIHWATGNNSPTRTRRALGFIFYSIHAVQDEAAHAAYQQKLAQAMHDSGKI